MNTRWALGAAACLFVHAVANAQDRRTVTEPRVPVGGARLTARLVSRAGTLAPDDEPRLDTERIQRAIDGCRAGEAIRLVADGGRNAFLAGALELRRGVTLVVERGVTLYGSRDPRQYEMRRDTCGIVTESGERGCRPLIHVAAPDAAVMGDGVIDARGGATLLGRGVSWWDLAEQARAGDRHQQVPRLIAAERADNFTIYRITLKNSPNFHVSYASGTGFTAWGVVIDTPGTARNTDGIDPISATDVTIAHSDIRAGDDSVAIKAGDAGPSSHITIAHNHFYNGHGMSIGSETNGGVRAVRITDLSIDGADNGIRIKSNVSRGGLVSDVRYDDVCIRNTKQPIVFDSEYPLSGTTRNRVPILEDIRLHNVRVLGPGEVRVHGFGGGRDADVRSDGVVFGAAPEACPGQFVPFPGR